MSAITSPFEDAIELEPMRCAGDTSRDDRRQESLLRTHRAERTGDLERDVPLSWTQVLVALVSYTLLLSDVLRTGVVQLNHQFPRLEPNQVMSLGPFAYSIAHIQVNETVDSHSNWPYKFDTTSIAMRAFTEYLQVPSWPSCLLYKSPCAQQTIATTTIFRMLDSLVEVMAKLKSVRTPNNLTLRTTNKFIDRIHHFILPSFFHREIRRTNQAIYYDSKLLSTPEFALCSSRVRPYACGDFWTNFTTICHETNRLCKGVGRLFEHVAARYRLIQQQYPEMTLDMVVFESQEDPNFASLTLQAPKSNDIAVVTRVRNCSPHSAPTQPLRCSTIAVDDVRFESDALASNVNDWFAVVATLRALGQAYAWLRLSLLFVGCFAARSAEPRFAKAGFAVRVAAGLRTAFVIPSQVIVYGSLFPIVCYVVAHIVDSANQYELVSQEFNSLFGVLKLDLGRFLYLSAVMMRTVWVMALALHIVVLGVSKGKTCAPLKGVIGMPELAISFIVGLTIPALFRSISFRDSRVTSISPVVPSARIALLREMSFAHSQSLWGLLVRANKLDIKCLLASAVAYSTLLSIVWCCERATRNLRRSRRLHVRALSRSVVSYAAGTLWPTSALVVSWNGTVVQDRKVADSRHPSTFWKRGVAIAPDVTKIHAAHRRCCNDFTKLDGRNNKAESLLYLMNLAMFTDPITLLRVWWMQDHTICVLQSSTSGRLFLLPQTALDSEQDIPIDWNNYEVVLRVSAKDLPWQDLVHCG